MARIPIGVGTTANDGTGDPVRTVGQHLNTMLTEIYANTASLFTVEAFGAADGSGFWDTPFQAAITAIDAAGGGTLVLGPGTYKLHAWPTIPQTTFNNSLGTQYQQKPLRILGQGCYKESDDALSARNTPTGGTTLDIQNAATYGKITTTGKGVLTFEDLNLTDSTAASGVLLYTTNTVLYCDNVCFFGQNGYGATSAQDAITFGGTVDTFNGNNPTYAFQGYGTIVRNCYFHQIRTVALFNTAANGIYWRDNTIWNTCGSADLTAAIRFVGNATEPTFANQVQSGIVELTNYQVGVYATYASDIGISLQFFDLKNPGVANNNTWAAVTGSPTYISATQFSLTGNQAATLLAHPYIKCTVTGTGSPQPGYTTTFTGKVTAAVFGTVTTVTVSKDPWSPTLDSGITAVTYGDAYTKMGVYMDDYCKRFTLLGCRTAELDGSNGYQFENEVGQTQQTDGSHVIQLAAGFILPSPTFGGNYIARNGSFTNSGRTWAATGYLNDTNLQIYGGPNGVPLDFKILKFNALTWNTGSVLCTWDFTGGTALNPTIPIGVPLIAAASVPTPTHATPSVGALFIDSSNANKLTFRDSSGTLHVITHT